MSISRIVAVAGVCGLILCWSAAGQGVTSAPAGDERSARDLLIRDAYAAVIRADMARDEKRYDDAVELYVVALDVWDQVSARYPNHRTSDIERNSIYCRNEAKSLVPRVELKQPIGDKLKARLADVQRPVYSGLSVTESGIGDSPAVSKGYSEDAMRQELERLRTEMFDATRREAAAAKNKAEIDAAQRIREADEMRRDGEVTRKQNEESARQVDAAKKQKDAAVKQSAAAKRDMEAAAAASKVARKKLDEVNSKCDGLEKQKSELERKLSKMGIVEQTAQSEKAQREATEQLLEKIDKENKSLAAEKKILEQRVDKLEETLMSAKDTGKKALAKKADKQVAAKPEEAESGAADQSVARQATSGVSDVVMSDARIAEDIKTSDAVAAECSRLIRAGQGDKALELVVYGLAKSQNNPQLLLMLGTLHVNAARYKEAIDLMRPLVSGEQGTAKARVVLGAALFGAGNIDEARMELEMALGLDPDLSEAHYNFAQLLLNAKPPSPVRADEHYKEALRLGSEPDPALEAAISKAMAGGKK
ncbi:MAG: hypothetical protein WCN95_10790 [bacterium]